MGSTTILSVKMYTRILQERSTKEELVNENLIADELISNVLPVLSKIDTLGMMCGRSVEGSVTFAIFPWSKTGNLLIVDCVLPLSI